ncbi:MAG: metalloregulator ArsR/SmtB family transcription factor [Pseudomonadota bacterium]
MMTQPEQGAFRALADPTRRAILAGLDGREMTIGEVAERFEMTRPAVRKHLTVLEEGGLISIRAEGRERLTRLEPQGIRVAADWLAMFSRYWDDKLAALKAAVEEDEDSS